MEKEFVPYEQALALKVLGFDEHCIAYYHNRVEPSFVKDLHRGDFTKNSKQMLYSTDCAAPTFSQAFRFFREKYNLRGFIGFRPNVKLFDHHVYDMSLSGKEYVKQRTLEEFNKDPLVGTYEEAELACIEKLIEIVESKS